MTSGWCQVWEHLASDVWSPLASYSAEDAAAPLDLFSDLFRATADFIAPAPGDDELQVANNDPEAARARFLALKGTDFISELAIVDFITESQGVVADYEIPNFEEFYRRLLSEALSKFNLPYRLDETFKLNFLLPGSFASLYGELGYVSSGDENLAALWNDFEEAYDRYARTQSDSDLRASISRTSNYLEGLASATRGRAGTLGWLCDRLSDWPHDKVKDALKALYGFCSDYPGIRHAGNPANRRRQLDPRDSVAINVSLIALAAYLSNGLDPASALGIGAVSTKGRHRLSPPRAAQGDAREGWIPKLRKVWFALVGASKKAPAHDAY